MDKNHHNTAKTDEPFLVPLDDRFSICVEKSTDPEYPSEVYVGVQDTRTGIIQDIAVVRAPYTYDINDNDGPHFESDKVELLCYEDETSEDYTRSIIIPLYKEEDHASPEDAE
jgi:hypothetical protein